MAKKELKKVPSREEARVKELEAVKASVNDAIMHCEDDRDCNMLAILLLVKALDILESVSDGVGTVEFVSFMIQDRRAKRYVEPTPENLTKQAVVVSWTGK